MERSDVEPAGLPDKTALRRGRDAATVRDLEVAALAIRRILVDRARARGCQKRGGQQQKLSLDAALTISAEAPGTDLLALDEMLEKFSREHPDKARVVEMRFFGGLTEVEIAEALGLSERTVRREWSKARALLLTLIGD